jgi:hypothetical protein
VYPVWNQWYYSDLACSTLYFDQAHSNLRAAFCDTDTGVVTGIGAGQYTMHALYVALDSLQTATPQFHTVMMNGPDVLASSVLVLYRHTLKSLKPISPLWFYLGAVLVAGTGPTVDTVYSAVSIVGDATGDGDKLIRSTCSTGSWGAGNVVLGHGSIAIGNALNVLQEGGISFGTGNTHTGANTISIGHGISAGVSSVGIGVQATSGLNAVALGIASNASGDNSVALGYAASAANANTIAIGPNALAAAGTIQLGAAAAGYAAHVGAAAWTYDSDERYKENIEYISDPVLPFLSSLRLCNFTYKNDTLHRKHVGFIAQEVQRSCAESNLNSEMVTANADGYLSLAYSEIHHYMLKGVQELLQEITLLKEKVAALEARVYG